MKTWVLVVLILVLLIGGAIAVYFILNAKAKPTVGALSNDCQALKNQYTDLFINKKGEGMDCYTGTYYDADNAINWFNPTQAPCTRAGSNCNGTKKRACETTIANVNEVITKMRQVCKG